MTLLLNTLNVVGAYSIMTNEEYQRQMKEWQNLPTNQWNDNLLKAAVGRNTNWSNIYTGQSDLGNTTLSGADAKLVSQYFAAKGYGRNEEWIGSNADSYWMRQLRDAQNWAGQNDKTQGIYQAELNSKGTMAKQTEMDAFQKNISSQQDALFNQLQQAYNDNNKQQQDALNASLRQLRESQDSASRAAAEQEARRMQQEDIRIQNEGIQNVAKTASRGLQGTDADRYQGELQQQGSQFDFIRSQLASVGIDQGFLSNYDIGAKASQANQLTDTYNQYRSQAPDSLISKYGGVSQAQQELEKQYSQSQTGVLDYDSQVRNSLSQLGSLYSSFNRLGDINSVQGNTGQERVASLFGVQKVDTSGAQNQFGSQQEAYNKQLANLAQISGGMNQELVTQFQNPFADLSRVFNEQVSELGNTYQQGANQLYGLYGDAQAMSSGRVFNAASQQQGLLSSGATRLGSTLGQASNMGTNLMSKYNETANALRNARTNERNTYYANDAQRRFNAQRASQLTNYASNIGKQLNKGQQINDPNLTNQGDSLLNRYSLFA